MKRTFVAISVRLEPEVLEAVAALQLALTREEFRWAPASNFHLTLHFLGATDSQQEESLIELLAEFSKNLTAFRFKLKGLNYFKRGSEPQVLFVPVVQDVHLQSMAADLISGLAELGFPIDEKAFRPHLTLARMKRVVDKAEFLKVLDEAAGDFEQNVRVSEIILYESILKSSGPQYVPIRVFGLKC